MARTPERKRPARRPAGLSPEDAALFDAAMKDVATIRRGMDPAPETPAAPTERPVTPPKIAPRARPPATPRPAGSLPALRPGQSADVDTRTLERLRRGRLRPDARVDLHGMTQAEAHRTLEAFLARAQASGARCVVVITGKGRIGEGGGVLRNQAPHWLNSPSIRPRILAFAPAQPRDGGSGALYVLLRRSRLDRIITE